MRKITGDLGLVGIANLLQLLSSSQAQGRLSIASGSAQKVIGFANDGIRLLQGVHRTNPLGEILLRTRKITQAQLEDLLKEQRASRQRLGDLAAERGIITQQALETALREQVAEEIYDLFTWAEAVFEFAEADEPLDPATLSPLSSVILDANVVSIMIEAARRLDELARIREVLTDFQLVVEQVEIPLSIEDPGLDPLAVEDLLPLIDGARTVEKIVEESLYPKFTVLRTIYVLAQRGIVKIRKTRAGEEPKTVIYRRAPAARNASDRPLTVLLVSELITFRGALGFILRNAGYDVREADKWDPKAAALCQACVNLILLDASIESEDGLAVCQRVRESSGIPFILLSGNRGREAAANAVRSGARFVLIKPIQENILLERIQSILHPPSPASSKPADALDALDALGG
jgi:CheY-like chemotaxis protein